MKKALFLSVAILTIVSMSACRIEKAYDSKEPAKTYHLNLTGFTSLSNASNRSGITTTASRWRMARSSSRATNTRTRKT